MDRLPTREEVEAHAKAHGKPQGGWPDAPMLGLWMFRRTDVYINKVQIDFTVMGQLHFICDGFVTVTSQQGTLHVRGGWQSLPLTADGLPVALVDEVKRLRDDPELDATDGAHPAWWRGHDHASKQWRAKIDHCAELVELVKELSGGKE